jgi:hypothetical protein
MKTFFYVLQKCIKSNQIIYPNDENFQIFSPKNYHKDFLDVSSYMYLFMYDMFYTYVSCKITNLYLRMAKAKLSALNCLLNNIFISNELKEKILDIFCKAQRHYYELTKFSNIYRCKKWPLVVACDLTLNPLSINHPATFVLLQNRSKYLFSMNDLINIIETSLSNAPNFFLNPLPPKNPYNNQKLNTSTLCNIYFKMKEGLCNFSLIMHLFFLENFIKNDFYINNEGFLREYAIKKYVYNSHWDTLYNAVKIMLQNNDYTNKLIIHSEFPKDLLVNIFRPYLYYYYIIHFSIKGTEKIYKYKNKLHIKFLKFYEYNSLFGRKICSGRRRKFIKRPFNFKFNTDHISFFKKTSILTIFESKHYDPNELFYENDQSINNDTDFNSSDSDDSDDSDDSEDN